MAHAEDNSVNLKQAQVRQIKFKRKVLEKFMRGSAGVHFHFWNKISSETTV